MGENEEEGLPGGVGWAVPLCAMGVDVDGPGEEAPAEGGCEVAMEEEA